MLLCAQFLCRGGIGSSTLFSYYVLLLILLPLCLQTIHAQHKISSILILACITLPFVLYSCFNHTHPPVLTTPTCFNHTHPPVLTTPTCFNHTHPPVSTTPTYLFIKQLILCFKMSSTLSFIFSCDERRQQKQIKETRHAID